MMKKLLSVLMTAVLLVTLTASAFADGYYWYCTKDQIYNSDAYSYCPKCGSTQASQIYAAAVENDWYCQYDKVWNPQTFKYCPFCGRTRTSAGSSSSSSSSASGSQTWNGSTNTGSSISEYNGNAGGGSASGNTYNGGGSSANGAGGGSSSGIADYGYIVGDMVTFGSYPQSSNGKSAAIEWTVLDINSSNGTMLLVSRYSLDCQQYYSERVDVTWEESDLRAWLANTFLNDAFTAKQRSAIRTTTVSNSRSQTNRGSYGGSTTYDKIFVLSYAEMMRYMPEAEDRMCAPTDYAIRQGANTKKGYTTEGRTAGSWWLRGSGSSLRDADVMIGSGATGYSGWVDLTYIAVRPAMWVDMNSNYIQLAN